MHDWSMDRLIWARWLLAEEEESLGLFLVKYWKDSRWYPGLMLYMINRKYVKKKKRENVKECQMGGIFRQLFILICGMLWTSGGFRDQFILFLVAVCT